MKSGNEKQNVTRRGFIRGASLLGLGGAAAALADPETGATVKEQASAPVGIDLGRFGKVDPKLIGYKQVGSLTSPLPEPKRVVAGPGDEVVVVAGKHVADVTGLLITATEEVRCLTIAGDGLIYVGLRESIEVYDGKAQRVATWKPEIKKPWFTSLAVGENDLFAADAANRVVFRFDRTGKMAGRIGEKNKEKGIPGFVVPSPYFDLEIGRDGLLWVANPGHSRLEAYSFDGRLESTWGEASFGINGFCGCCNPSYFTRLADGRFVTSEKGLARVKVYSAKGEFGCVVAGPEAFPKYFANVNSLPVALDVAADSKGRILVADTLGGCVRVYEKV
jgi:hypothetical protein